CPFSLACSLGLLRRTGRPASNKKRRRIMRRTTSRLLKLTSLPLKISTLALAILSSPACSAAGDQETGIAKWWDQGLQAYLYLGEQILNLYENNIIDSYGVYPANLPCSDESRSARTVEGHCNDLTQTRMGGTDIRFGRNVPLASAYVDDANLMEPNPRPISQALMT